MTEKLINQFRSFIDDINPEDFSKFSDGSVDAKFSELLNTNNASEIRTAGGRVQELIEQTERTEPERSECFHTAFALAGNPHIDIDTADILMAFYLSGVGYVGKYLAHNPAMRPDHYRYLVESDDNDQRVALALNPMIQAPVLAELLQDEYPGVVIAALDHRNTSDELMRLAKPDIIVFFFEHKATQVRQIQSARTAKEFNECALPWFDDRLSEAYAHSMYSPEHIIRRLAQSGSIAGMFVLQCLQQNFYEFQREEAEQGK